MEVTAFKHGDLVAGRMVVAERERAGGGRWGISVTAVPVNEGTFLEAPCKAFWFDHQGNLCVNN